MECKLKNITTESFKFENIVRKEKFNIIPVFGKKITKINEENYEVKLMFSIKDEEEKPSPYNIELIIKGLFQMSNFTDDEYNEFMNINAIQILIPYLRGILASSMSAMMVPPITIPIMDSRNIFSNSNINEEDH